MKETILVVDDEEGIRNVLRISLADAGHEVYTAKSGTEALDIVKDVRPAIVLADIKMPGMDGIELLKRIKQEHNDSEVIMITGHSDLDLAIRALKYDATDFITKPISADALEVALKRSCERISMRRKLSEYTQNLERLVEEKTRKLIATERLAAAGETVASLSHAIKNVASGLEGGSFVLEKGIELDNRKYLLEGWEMLRGNVDKIKGLSLDLLSYAKPIQINPELGDPNEPAREVVALMRSRAEQGGISLKLDLSTEVETVLFDAESIHRCLLDLVTNAVEACTEGDIADRQKEVVLRTVKPDGWGVEYQVIDNCCGIDETILGKIFSSFVTTKGIKGTGIGLMLTKKVVDEHGGTIEVQSEKGAGSRFVIRLPASDPRP